MFSKRSTTMLSSQLFKYTFLPYQHTSIRNLRAMKQGVKSGVKGLLTGSVLGEFFGLSFGVGFMKGFTSELLDQFEEYYIKNPNKFKSETVKSYMQTMQETNTNNIKH
eukprot:96928_1